MTERRSERGVALSPVPLDETRADSPCFVALLVAVSLCPRHPQSNLPPLPPEAGILSTFCSRQESVSGSCASKGCPGPDRAAPVAAPALRELGAGQSAATSGKETSESNRTVHSQCHAGSDGGRHDDARMYKMLPLTNPAAIPVKKGA